MTGKLEPSLREKLEILKQLGSLKMSEQDKLAETVAAQAEIKPALGQSLGTVISFAHDPATCHLCAKYRKENNDAG